MPNLNILSINTQKAPKSIASLFSNPLTHTTLDLILVTECPKRLQSQPHFNVLVPDSTSLHRSIIYVNKRIDPASYRQVAISESGDIVAVDLKHQNGSIRIISLYNPPKSISNLSLLSPLILSLPPNHLLLLAGDMNAHDPSWMPLLRSPTTNGAIARDTFIALGLVLLLPPGTDTRPNYNVNSRHISSTIDLVFGTPATEERTLRCDIDLTFEAGSDHQPILTTLDLTFTPSPPTTRRNFRRLDVERLSAHYRNNNTFNIGDLASFDQLEQEAIDIITDISNAINATVPLSKPSKYGVPWWNESLFATIKESKRLMNYWNRHRHDLEAKKKAYDYRRQKNSIIRTAKREYDEERAKTTTSKTMWERVKETTGRTSTPPIPPLVRGDGSRASTTEEKAALFVDTLFPARIRSDQETERDEEMVERRERRSEPTDVVDERAEVVDRFLASVEEEVAVGRRELITSRLESVPTYSNLTPSSPTDSNSSNDDEDSLTDYINDQPLSSDEEQVGEEEIEPDQFSTCTNSPNSRLSSFSPSPSPRFLSNRGNASAIQHFLTNTSSSRLDPTAKPFVPAPAVNNNTPTNSAQSTPTSRSSSPSTPFASPLNETQSEDSCANENETIEWEEITDYEVKRAFFALRKSSSPGHDTIPAYIYQSLWAEIGDRITRFIRACFSLGFEPLILKEALVVILRKPKKADYSLPNAYRPISLLSSLSKALEKVMATRIVYYSEKFGLLPKEVFGGRPGLSVEDAILAATSAIKAAQGRGNVVAGIAFDVKGAFTNVDRVRLLANMRRRRIPEQMLGMVSSFMQNRSCYLSVEGSKSKLMMIDAGIPQGSPLSPILYIFYNADLGPLLRSPSSSSILWIDDLFVLFHAKTAALLTDKVHELLPTISKWSKDHFSPMEPAKSHLIIFSNARNKPILPPILLDNIAIPVAESILLLGITLDSHLNYHQHIAAVTAKASSAIAGLRCLASRTRGFSFTVVRLLAISCVFSKLDFGSTIWFNPAKSKGHLARLDSVLLAACVLVTGGFKAAGTAALAYEANLLPTRLRLQRRAFARLATLRSASTTHPLYDSLVTSFNSSSKSHLSPLDHNTRFFSSLHPESLDIETLTFSPISPSIEPITTNVRIAATSEEAIANHDEIFNISDESTLLMYSEGSLKNDQVGACSTFRMMIDGEFRWGKKVTSIGGGHTFNEGGLEGVRLSLSAILDLLSLDSLSSSTTDIYLFIDNKLIISNCCSPIRSNGQQFRQINSDLLNKINNDHPQVSIHFEWIPGGEEILGNGNELADKFARVGAANDTKKPFYDLIENRVDLVPKALITTIGDYGTSGADEWAIEWKEGKTGGDLKKLTSLPPSSRSLRLHSKLNRRSSSILTQLRTSRSPLRADLFKIHLSPHSNCDCGERETRQHYFLSCPRFNAQRLRLRSDIDSDSFDLRTILDEPKNSTATIRFITDSNRFPRYNTVEPVIGRADHRGVRRCMS